MNMIWVCGVDEAGRGPLVGAVVAGAVVLDPENPIEGLKDSKKLSAVRREFLYEQIMEKAKAWGVGEASPTEIDSINILQATMLAMRRAVEDLAARLGEWPSKALIDGNRCPELSIAAEAIVKGDTKEPAISAASIVAKVTRDRQMIALHEQHPQYGFSQHMGYPTEAHFAALKQYGVCTEHRKSFAPVRRVLEGSF
ncbi:ribonuclease HII [Polynucleobacter asymbioticus]|jgi:ribonuclease HII|uniref:Ribonuclease HII n=2 Tax=Polynucleobacter asymbioticus TaxID=576611 RepID=RNH2_POLAQ|nr:ribonuclease HII [Polynucleobacter asymbioticus]A4SYT7.1 RecName: Full=Ribonuclease HII; Short=RNase HII [Polynucleobacter asymbioticus QLW-P1DMWA-1]ABP34651.1 RNase HII [Polynucleobacter asymbioticus QLW-P1DMWA-1]APB99327.1 ribonuclease HII [Polynucleobacter asymbioticus]APC01635.1 ribonuclease HII [Polynucleobacter asymbioticus]APC06489.1 ribonuclease HII [Polynucleobacter asymbioticus]